MSYIQHHLCHKNTVVWLLFMYKRVYVCRQTTSFYSDWRAIAACLSQFSIIRAPPPPIPSSALLRGLPNWIWILFLPCCCVLLKFIFIFAGTNNSIFNAKLHLWICKNTYNTDGGSTLTKMNFQKLDFGFIIEMKWISIWSTWWPWLKLLKASVFGCKELRPSH